MEEKKSLPDDIICVNGKPMEKIATQYEYDVYIATAPKNCFDDIDIIEPSPLYYNYDACDADEDRDSEDSNDENHHQNEYPDGEESDFDEGPDYGEDYEYYDSDNSFRASYSDDGLDGLVNQLGGINLSKELRRIAGYPFSAERDEECSSDSDSS